MTSTLDQADAVLATPEHRTRLSGILRGLCELSDGQITIGEIVDSFGRRAFGAMLFVFAIPNLLPLPPGSSSILGLPLILLAPQVAIGVRAPWLPRFIDDRKVKGADLKRGFSRLLPSIEKVEMLSRARWAFMFGPVGDRLIGLVCTLLAFVLILPIPLGNLAPAAAIGTLGMALFQRDGVIALVGYFLAAVSGGLLVLSAGAVGLAVGKMLSFIGM